MKPLDRFLWVFEWTVQILGIGGFVLGFGWILFNLLARLYAVLSAL